MRRENTLSDDERAVSEAISYVLVFGLMTVGGTLVALQGVPALENTQEAQLAENAERAVLLMQDTVEGMVRQDAPRREVTVDVQDFTVGVGGMEPASIDVTTDGDTLAELESDPVYIETETVTAVYENGAVLVGERGSSDSWTMASRPSWAVSTNNSKVRSVFVRSVSATGGSSVTGQGTRARLVFESVNSRINTTDDVNQLEMSVESPRYGAWREYFESLNASVDGGDGTVSGNRVTLKIDSFEGGAGRVSHRTQVIRAEVGRE